MILDMSLDSTAVCSIMNPNVKVDSDDQNINSACKIMADNKIGCVVIVPLGEIKKPIGIFTESDVVKVLGKLAPWLMRTPLRELMSKPVITVSLTSSVKEAMQIMSNKNIRRLVVVDRDHKMVGIITLKDIFKIINRSPELLTEFYGPNFPLKFTEMHERFTEFKFDSPSPGL